ncbi:ABC transporter ATP-binding protein [Halanaerobium congolense]|jgi:NitT/TauT family transport system ATP-binding protein|uniref:NitT/TauT family transport system ATP-binding protein n=1 Tax=Halanaerobium congolense TaxID=54121 RepID=A0A1G6NSH3_9FIRM|nr:ABC transporter ATP-binding protein [Halanaerobium congolense]PTX17856.1 NitT/TauT family transport system ATP-binding protein [Halanaerobium congolense]PXV63473.1 NitT/TauT family transport system ATP-binding protein [Halanaerobium congolense]TDP19127.1 NitT/TauT family transport system ATP-binding protein [Halanaerobium congolense]TDS29527.1 NitT/TauT family transport system ATP-binding protein [Halanaerobium congolense]TDX43774.1 NitT/TauT family transport system ATP-binding protein [Hal
MSSYLELKNIAKSFNTEKGKKIALKDINLQIKKNEFLTILGPSGCGKSTLLKIIAGFIKSEKGKLLKNEQLIEDSGLDRIMLFQEFEQLFSWQTVIDNISFAVKASAKNKNIKLTKRQIKEKSLKYLNEVKLKSYQDYYPHQLSGGMKQRVALARTLAAEGEIMLMDEPFGSVDSQTRQELQQLLAQLWQEEDKTIIFVTHDIREAVFLSERIVLMKNEPGEIIELVDNKLPHPRKRSSREFNQLFEQLQTRLQN